MNFDGKVVVVTGGSSGIGRAIVERFLSGGASVVTCHFGDTKGAASLMNEAEAGGWSKRLQVMDADISKRETSARLVQTSLNRFGDMHTWVNNAAIQRLAKSEELEETEWHKILSVNLDGYFFGCQAAAKHFITKRRGSIINITSGVNLLAVKYLAAYTAAKGAIASLTRALAVEWGPYGVTVNSVAPGATDTPLNLEVYTPEVRRLYNERIPLGHIATPDEIASAVTFLASPESSYVTGHELVVDGGLNYNGTVYHPLD